MIAEFDMLRLVVYLVNFNVLMHWMLNITIIFSRPEGRNQEPQNLEMPIYYRSCSCHSWLTGHSGTVGVRLRACLFILPIIMEETVIYSISSQKWLRKCLKKLLIHVSRLMVLESIPSNINAGRLEVVIDVKCMFGFIQLSQSVQHGKMIM